MRFSILDAVLDPKLFKPAFKDMGTWWAQIVYLRALFNLPIKDPDDVKLFRECTGLSEPPRERVRESFVVCGRGGLAGGLEVVTLRGSGEAAIGKQHESRALGQTEKA